MSFHSTMKPCSCLRSVQLHSPHLTQCNNLHTQGRNSGWATQWRNYFHPVYRRQFHVSVNNINFLDRVTLSPSGTGNTGNHSLSFFVSFPFWFVQLPWCHLDLLASNLTSMLCPVLLQILLWQILLPLLHCSKLVYWHEGGNIRSRLVTIVHYKCYSVQLLAACSTGVR